MNYVRVYLIILFFFLIVYPCLSKESVFISDFYIHESILDTKVSIPDVKINFTIKLYSFLNIEIRNGAYRYLLCSAVGNNQFSNWFVRNDTDAYGVASLIGAKYLVYGSIKKIENYFEADVKIYNKEKNVTIKEFSHIYNGQETTQFIKEIAYKLDSVVLEIFGLEKKDYDSIKRIEDLANERKRLAEEKAFEEERKEKIKNFKIYKYIGLSCSLGYFFPIGKWLEYYTGVINIEVGIKGVNLQNIYDNKKNFKITFSPGFAFSYSLSTSKPQYADSKLNTFLFKFPFDLLFVLEDKYKILFDTGVQAQIDLFYQNLYGITTNIITNSSFGWFVGCGFEYELDKKGIFSVGNTNIFDFASYQQFYADYKIQFYCLIKFPKKINKKGI